MPSNSQKKHTISNKVRKRPGKDIDQIHEDLKPNKARKLLNQEIDLDLPGDGQFYCIECERYFIDEKTRIEHRKSKLHKNRVRSLKEVPYSIKEAEAAAGRGHYKHVTLKSKVSEETAVTPLQQGSVFNQRSRSCCWTWTLQTCDSQVQGSLRSVSLSLVICEDRIRFRSAKKLRLHHCNKVPYSIKEAEAAAGRGHYKHVTLKSKVSEETAVTPLQQGDVTEMAS